MADKIPSRLFKYQPYNTQTLDNLKKRVIWFSKPSSFNDPFDLSIGNNFEYPSEDELLAFYDVVSHQLGVSRSYSDKLFLTEGRPNRKLGEWYLSAARFADKGLVLENQEYGVACFARRVNNILMWAHYADGHRGLCLEFDTSFPPFDEARHVTYSPAYPAFNAALMLLKKEMPNPNPILLTLTTKSPHWAYEKEWRVLRNKQANTEFEIDTRCLTGIYFGCAMPCTHKEITSMILKGSPTKLYEMKRSETEFRVDPCALPDDYARA